MREEYQRWQAGKALGMSLVQHFVLKVTQSVSFAPRRKEMVFGGSRMLQNMGAPQTNHNLELGLLLEVVMGDQQRLSYPSVCTVHKTSSLTFVQS